MPQLRFNHVFVVLLLLSLISAFFIPAQYTDRLYHVQKLFVLVSYPARTAAAWFSGKVSPDVATDGRPDEDIRRENDELKVAVANLQGQVERLQRVSAERSQLGKLLDLCTVVAVAGADAANRETLNLNTSGVTLKNGQPVIYPGGLVGRIERGGAMVRLITDKNSKPVNVIFGRVVRESDAKDAKYHFQQVTGKVAVFGAGNNQLIARQELTVRQVEDTGLKVGDWAVMYDDAEFPMALAYLRVGQVKEVRQSVTAPLYADVYLQPMGNLSELREVMVVTNEGAARKK